MLTSKETNEIVDLRTGNIILEYYQRYFCGTFDKINSILWYRPNCSGGKFNYCI